MSHTSSYSRRCWYVLSLSILTTALQACLDDDRSAPSPRLMVTWTDNSGTGGLASMTTQPPFQIDGEPMTIGAAAIMRCGAGDLYVLSQADGSIFIVDFQTRQSEMIASVGVGEAVDIAVSDPTTAYVTRRTATHLLRLDIASGATTDVVDLSPFADDDGIPDLGMMAIHEGRLYIQILRSTTDPFGFAIPPYIAVLDLETEELIDTDPGVPGVQLIELQGTAPKHKMQVVAESRELFLSASGTFHDQGGLEIIDLDTLSSKGMIIREDVDAIGADLGAFVMVNADEGFLVSSTDLDVSSHLQRFSVDGGIDPPPDLYQSIGYTVPALQLDSTGEILFMPDGQHDSRGIMVLDVISGGQLLQSPLPIGGVPTDILLECTS